MGQKTKIPSGIHQKYMLGQRVKNIWTGQARGFIKVGPVHRGESTKANMAKIKMEKTLKNIKK